jgi:cytochrome P450
VGSPSISSIRSRSGQSRKVFIEPQPWLQFCGEAVAIFVPSANRDEVVFADADSFCIDRTPNPHIVFGWAAHHCLAHALAPMELRALFGELLPRLRSAEIAGPTWRAQSLFPTGFTSLPVRLDLAWRPVAGLVGSTVRTLIAE